MIDDPNSLFVWRGHKSFIANGLDQLDRSTLPSIYQVRGCPFCRGPLGPSPSQPFDLKNRCRVCGFWKHHISMEVIEGTDCSPEALLHSQEYSPEALHVATIKKFDINDADVGLSELGAHLRRRPRALHSLTPRRFELIVADVFRNLGYHTRLTQQTRDNGYDIMLMEAASGRQTIVECKRYAAHRKVSVGIVRELLGVQLHLGISRAKIVTTTHFTRPAKQITEDVNVGSSGYELDLVDIDTLVSELGVYNKLLPPLRDDPRFVEQQ